MIFVNTRYFDETQTLYLGVIFQDTSGKSSRQTNMKMRNDKQIC